MVERLLRESAGRGVHTRVAGTLRDGKRTLAALAPAGAARPNGRTRFEIGSVTKAFTGVLLAEMAVRGELELSGRLEQLATHRSGLPNTPLPRRELLAALGLWRGDPWADVTAADHRRMVEALRRRRWPRVRYSSIGFGLLGDELAARAGMPFERLLQERVCAPLGLADTSFEPASLAGRSPRGRPRPPLRDLMPAAGSLRSTADDMLRFLGACLDPPPGPLGEALTLASQPRARINRRASIGLGWIVLSRPGRARLVWHNGGTWGFRSFAGFVPGEDRAAVVLSNTTRSVDRLGFRLLEAA